MKSKDKLTRIILWTTIFIYTLLLPHAVILYRSLVNRIGRESVGKVPLYTVVIIGLAYVVFGLIKNRDCRHLLFLIPSAIIAYSIIQIEPNPNKHIHIPEYVLMAWLLYSVLEMDYQGKGIFILVFLCGSMLGVIDELEQGIHPRRFYGWSDMAVNTCSVLIGIFTILGLFKTKPGNWKWFAQLSQLSRFRGMILALGFEFVGALLSCIFLFDVQANQSFRGIYPNWLLVWNYTALALTLGTLYIFFRSENLATGSHRDHGEMITVKLWLVPPMLILFHMHALVLIISLLSLKFK